jgi:hypothetical protein
MDQKSTLALIKKVVLENENNYETCYQLSAVHFCFLEQVAPAHAFSLILEPQK